MPQHITAVFLKENEMTMHPIEILTFDLLQGKCPSATQITNLCYALHHAMIEADVPEMLWLEMSFEDMGDLMHKAIKNAD